jgi:hypothetical protein
MGGYYPLATVQQQSGCLKTKLLKWIEQLSGRIIWILKFLGLSDMEPDPDSPIDKQKFFKKPKFLQFS